jgi:AAA15 family ATPase/GTPase
MLLRFSIDNFLSFKNSAVLDFQAASIKEYKENIFHLPFSGNIGLLKSIGFRL